MSAGGSINAMNISLKNNKRPKKKVIFNEKLQPSNKKSNNLKKLLEKKLTKENLKSLKMRLIKRKKREQQVEIIVFSLLLAIGITFIVSLFIMHYYLPFLDKLD